MSGTRLLPAALWMIGALLSFSTMAVSVRALAGSLAIFEILAIRNALALGILTVLALLRSDLRHGLAPHRLGLHLFRNGIHCGGQYLWAYSVTVIPLAMVFALEFTVPVWTALMAVVFLGERLTPSRIGVVVFGFIGVLVIVRPGLDAFQPAAGLVLLAAFGFGTTMISTKELTKTATPFAIVFWMNLMQLPMAYLGCDPLFVMKVDSGMVVPIVAVAISGLTGHFCLSNAFRVGEAMVVVPMDFARIPLIALVGWWLYREPIDAYVFAGAGLIIIGVVWNLRAESRRGRNEVVAPAEH
jgi:drug/metabolite transporter (DMT)-like permease